MPSARFFNELAIWQGFWLHYQVRLELAPVWHGALAHFYWEPNPLAPYSNLQGFGQRTISDPKLSANLVGLPGFGSEGPSRCTNRISPTQGRGKIERFFQTVQKSFLPEAKHLMELGQLDTLEELNELFWAWLEVTYHTRVHGTTKQTPLARFEGDTEPLRHIDPTELREVFLWEDERTVDQTGCFSLHRNHYEVDSALVRRKITLRYDPFDLSQIQVWHDGKRFADAVPLQLRRSQHKSVPAAPEPQTSTPKSELNYLTLSKKQYDAERRAKLGQTAFTRLVQPKGGQG